MYRGFDYLIKEDVIVLCHLKTIYEGYEGAFRNIFHSYEEFASTKIKLKKR